MSTVIRKLTPFQKLALAALVAFLVLFASLAAYRIVSGRSLGLRSLASGAVSFVKGLAGADRVQQASSGDYTNVIFLHHSVGRNLIDQGGVRELLTQAGITFWDHDYNDIGLRDPAGQYLGFSYNIPNDNTDFDGLAVLFSQRAYSLPVNAVSSLLQHEVIILKSCYPNSAISSAEQLRLHQEQFLSMRAAMDRHPDKLFILVTQPPLIPSETVAADADRAREMAAWLTSEEFLQNRANVVIFDFFDLLAVQDEASPERNMLRPEYRNGTDPHPNQSANETIGPLFAGFVLQAIDTFRAE
jgi:hypothetical protein